MNVYVVREYLQIPEYSGNVDEQICIYGDIKTAIGAVRTMFQNKADELEKEHHIIRDSLFVSHSDGYCSGVIQYKYTGMNESIDAWNISCREYEIK